MSFAIAGTVLTIGATAYGANRANAAGRAGARGANNATAESARQYDQSRADQAPWMTTGAGAINQLGRLFGLPTQTAQQSQWDNSQLVQSQGGIPTMDAQRYANDPAYKYAWDKTLANEQATRPGWSGQSTYNMRANDSDWTRLNSTMGQYLAEYNTQNPQQQQGGQAGSDMSGFFTSPGYQFRRDEGTRGIERTAAAQGGAFSGNALKALAEFNSGLASQEFGQYFNQLASIAGLGQTATAQTGAMGANHANNASRNALYAGDARASGIENQANIIGQGVNGLAGMYGYYSRNRSQPRMNTTMWEDG
jgi:hypothetical protein